MSASNMIIGNRYSVLKRVERDLKPDSPQHLRDEQQAFSEALKVSGVEAMGVKHVENCWGLLEYERGSEIYPLYQGFHYYIMTGNGETFEQIKPNNY